jgi:lysozyme family protein
MTNIGTLKAENSKRWIAAKLTRNFDAVARRLVEPNAKQKYLSVSLKTGVPWWFIAVVHEREGSQRWDTYLGNGQLLDRITTIVPKGRGPFSSWEEGAIDALVNCGPYAARNTDWSAGGSLSLLEEYNGLGYAARGLPSPYVWSGTNQYKSGKYIRDGVYDPNVVDEQLGCAGLLKAMILLDSSITFTGSVVQEPKTDIKPPIVQQPETRQNVFVSLIETLLSLFRGKGK